MFQHAKSYWRENQNIFQNGLVQFLSIPSVSARSAYHSHVRRAAGFVAQELSSMGMEGVRVVEGLPGEQPLVLAQWMKAAGAPTILLYAHYDVQPAEPFELWRSPPFQASIENGKIFARGAADDKGQLYILLKVLEGYLRSSGRLPVNVKVLFEGEEESNGTHIARFLREHTQELAASAAIVLDTGMFAPGIPTISTGLRGIVSAKLTCFGANADLHSGEHGGAAPNAAEGLSRIISGLKSPSGRVRIPGFYRQVAAPCLEEKHSWQNLPFSEEEYRHSLGAKSLVGDRRYSVLHRRWALPTLEINGIAGGYTGEGFKTVIPAQASAHISMRLAPGMDPDYTARLFSDYVAKQSPAHLRSQVEILSCSPAMLVDTSNLFIAKAAQAFKQVFGKETAFVREGGSIPVAADLQSVLNLPVLITGFTLPDCNMHAPNENLDLASFYAGIEAIGKYFDLLA